MAQEINLDPVIFALAQECPLHGGNPKDCQLYEVRKKSTLEKLTFIASLSEQTKLEMIECHERCFLKKHAEL